MALSSAKTEGQTPLDPDEMAGLIPSHLLTKDELNDWLMRFFEDWTSSHFPGAVAGTWQAPTIYECVT